MTARKQASKIPKMRPKDVRRLYANPTDQDIIYDTIEVANVITNILLGALIEPGRDGEQWVRRQIRDILAARELKRYRTYEILRNAQLKPSALEWLRFYFNKLELTKDGNGGHLHRGTIVTVDYSMPVAANV